MWGGIAGAGAGGAWRVRRAGASVPLFMDAIAPALLVAQAVGRLGNYFNQELFGGPTSLPWGLQIARIPAAGLQGFTTFQPTFLYEMLFDLALAGLLVWLGHHRHDPPAGAVRAVRGRVLGLPDLRGGLRVDSSQHFLGLRLNFFIATLLTVAGATWFVLSQRRRPGRAPPGRPGGTGPRERSEPASRAPARTGSS